MDLKAVKIWFFLDAEDSIFDKPIDFDTLVCNWIRRLSFNSRKICCDITSKIVFLKLRELDFD
ncbi:hypothetical protein ASG19_08650 [Rhizobium sp. Leaf306]|nr:hypothetical protein ASG19_08650 [Rhizobium sp. Leaf306]